MLPNGELASACIRVNRAGVELADDWDGIGQPYTGSGTIHFHDVRVVPEEILRSVADDSAHLLRERNRTYSHAAAQSPAQDPLLQQVVGEIASATFAAESILLQIPRSGRLASQRHGVTEQWFFLVPEQGMPVGTPGAKARYRP